MFILSRIASFGDNHSNTKGLVKPYKPLTTLPLTVISSLMSACTICKAVSILQYKTHVRWFFGHEREMQVACSFYGVGSRDRKVAIG